MSVELGLLALASHLEIRCPKRPCVFGPQEMQEGSSPLAVSCSGKGNLASESQLQFHNLASAGTQQNHEGCPPTGLREPSEESIHDSQIRNMNKWISRNNETADRQGMHLTPGQTWQFLTKVGVGGVDDSEMMVRRLAEMEARDVSRYEQAVAENIAADAEANNGVL
ncbi:hypothetical protein Ancab_029493 [Ancistrocladus abbreviatus]